MKKLYTVFFVVLSLNGFATTPTIPTSNLHFPAIDGGYLNVAWTAGNGARRVIICKAGSAVTFRPQNGSDYTDNTIFGSGQQVAPGEFVIYDNAFTSFGGIRGIVERNAANCYLQILFDLFFHRPRTIPMRQGESAVNLWFRGILWSEEFVKIFLGVDSAGVCIAKGEGTVEKALLDRVEAQNEHHRPGWNHKPEIPPVVKRVVEQIAAEHSGDVRQEDPTKRPALRFWATRKGDGNHEHEHVRPLRFPQPPRVAMEIRPQVLPVVDG